MYSGYRRSQTYKAEVPGRWVGGTVGWPVPRTVFAPRAGAAHRTVASWKRLAAAEAGAWRLGGEGEPHLSCRALRWPGTSTPRKVAPRSSATAEADPLVLGWGASYILHPADWVGIPEGTSPDKVNRDSDMPPRSHGGQSSHQIFRDTYRGLNSEAPGAEIKASLYPLSPHPNM